MGKDIAIRFDGVHKRFRRGELNGTLRDLIPSLVSGMFGRSADADDKRDFWALRDINLEVRHGETLGVIGHNGAGKSTMLKHLAGIMTPTRGRIEVDGRLAALIEVGAGFHQDLTGRENVYLSGAILGMSRAEVSRKFDAIVDFAEMASFIDTPVKRYSSGMFARLGFAVAAHLEPDILVIDEVLSVGDFVFQQKSLQKMREIAGGGATVIFVSHNLKTVSDLCQRSILMDGGTIIADGATSDILHMYLSRERGRLRTTRDVDVHIDDVVLEQRGESVVRLRAGDDASVTVRLSARRAAERVAVVLAVLDEGLEIIFDTSTQRLGADPVDLEAGESHTVHFDLKMHLAAGTFHVAVYLYRYDIQKEYDRVLPATTFFVQTDRDVRGAANLYPTVREERHELVVAQAWSPNLSSRDVA